jgi:hypothetical protein
MTALRDELTGPGPKPIERLLAERVTACWIQLHWAEATVAQARGGTIKQAELALRRQNSAHRRYLTALGALATAQRLLPAAKQPTALASPAEAPPECVDASNGPTIEARDIPVPRIVIAPRNDRDGDASPHADLTLFAAGDAAGEPDYPPRAATPLAPPQAG